MVWCVVFQVALLLTMSSPALQMSMNPHIGFTDGASHSAQNLSSMAWAIYDTQGELIDLQGICLGQTTNNIVAYSVVIEFLS